MNSEILRLLQTQLNNGEITKEVYDERVKLLSYDFSNPSSNNKLSAPDPGIRHDSGQYTSPAGNKKTVNMMIVMLILAQVLLVGGGVLGVVIYSASSKDGKSYQSQTSTYRDSNTTKSSSSNTISTQQRQPNASTTHTSTSKRSAVSNVGRALGDDSLVELVETSAEVVDTINQIDEDYKVTDSLNEIGRISQEKYKELDQKYDIKGKAETAEKKIRDTAKKYKVKEKAEAAEKKLREASNKFNKWLKSK